MPQRRTPSIKLLRGLRLFGLGHLDRIILAALADQRPLLLIGAHGTAKSALLNRLAESLGLRHRHYNASLISFDDLLGYPVPNRARNGLEYLRTDNDLWDAESVFLDEISRCRPESQNKLFSIIHERKVQGSQLKSLRYRWAAMNPPFCPDAEEGEVDEIYAGSLPLDPALADRFPYVVVMPTLLDLSKKDRLALIRKGDSEPDPAIRLADLVEQAKDAYQLQPESIFAWAASYVEALLSPLAEASFMISGRRAAFLVRNIVSVFSSGSVLGYSDTIADSAFLALKWGLPQRAQGRTVKESLLNAIHKQAILIAGEPESSPWHAIRATRDPVHRIALALPHAGTAIAKPELSNLVSDAFAALPIPKRYLLTRHLWPKLTHASCLNIPTLELLGDCAAKVAKFCGGETHQLDLHRSRAGGWNDLLARVNALSKEGEDGACLANYLLTVFAIEKEPVDAEELIVLDAEWKAMFAGVQVGA
jgi:MoxR-like ATPase